MPHRLSLAAVWACVLLAALPSYAQQFEPGTGRPYAVGVAPGGGQRGVPIAPPPLNGQGIMSVSSSATVNTANVVATGNSPAFPGGNLPGGFLTIKVQGSENAMVAVCWLGASPCTFATGEVIEVGEAATKNLFNTFLANPPTIVAQSGTVKVSVEW